ncbi:MAG: outer membrane beta-barrel protein [Flavobacteriales bacterium]|nr:outer membrane beta-barrel protein [Flavobacteriales bacterium]
MKRLSLLLGFGFLFLTAVAQENEVLLLQLKAGYSPDVAFRTLQPRDKNDSGEKQAIDYRNKDEVPIYGNTAYVSACYNLNQHIGVEAGLQYALKGYQTKQHELTYGQLIDPRYGFVYNPNAGMADKVRFAYRFHYIGIPIKFNYTLGTGKTRFFGSVAVVTEFLVSSQQTAVWSYSDGSKKRNAVSSPYDFRTVNFSPQLSAGVDYRINNRMGVLVEPTFRFGAINIVDAPIRGYLWSFGLNLSYYFGL